LGIDTLVANTLVYYVSVYMQTEFWKNPAISAFIAYIGGGRLYVKWESKNGGLEAVPPRGPGAKPPMRGLGACAPVADDIFVKICYFISVLRIT